MRRCQTLFILLDSDTTEGVNPLQTGCAPSLVTVSVDCGYISHQFFYNFALKTEGFAILLMFLIKMQVMQTRF